MSRERMICIRCHARPCAAPCVCARGKERTLGAKASGYGNRSASRGGPPVPGAFAEQSAEVRGLDAALQRQLSAALITAGDALREPQQARGYVHRALQATVSELTALAGDRLPSLLSDPVVRQIMSGHPAQQCPHFFAHSSLTTPEVLSHPTSPHQSSERRWGQRACVAVAQFQQLFGPDVCCQEHRAPQRTCFFCRTLQGRGSGPRS